MSSEKNDENKNLIYLLIYLSIYGTWYGIKYGIPAITKQMLILQQTHHFI